MMLAQEGILGVPGATLYYRTCGAGPLLLLLQGGAGDADGAPDLVAALADAFTVVTYDRRGLSRSTLVAGASPRLEDHGDDAHRLLAALTAEPALVVGCSLGALIGLELVARHPTQVRTLVAHEAPTPELLPASERERAERDRQDVEAVYHQAGAAAAMGRFLTMTGVRLDDREPDLALPTPTSQYAANIAFFLTHDAPAARRYRLDLAALQATSTRIVPAAGTTNRLYWIHACARALADQLGRELVEFPGGHNGYALHPRGFAARVRAVLAGPPGADRV